MSDRYKWWDDISRLDIMLRVTKTQVLSDEDRRDGAVIVARLADELGRISGLLAGREKAAP